jgi:subtilisin family serine protease
MPPPPDFPHLNLAFQGNFEPHFQGAHKPNPAVEANRASPQAHAIRIRGILGQMQQSDERLRQLRADQGRPAIPAHKGFLLKLPEGADVDQLIKTLGVELVAETEEGIMLVSSVDLQFAKLEAVLREFEAGTGSVVAGSSLLDIYDLPDDARRLANILSPEVLGLWPLDSNTTYLFDLGIQTAASTREVKWPRVVRRKDEPDADFQHRKETARHEAWIEADTEWQEKSEARVAEMESFIRAYGGEMVVGMNSEEGRNDSAGMVFPDSVQVRVKMSGEGFRDLILNFAHLFDVTFPPELQQEATVQSPPQDEPELSFRSPDENAASVCVIDSGIEEGHRWLAPSIDSKTSRCFLPEADPDDVADYVSPQGHGTRVAGAVLFPGEIPRSGEVDSVAWLQNARVLNADNKLPDNLTPEEYLQEVVVHFRGGPRLTKIFNHSINANLPCPRQRMTSWAAKMDQLSHEQDVLFIQSAGNQHRTGNGDLPNPGLRAHLEAGRQPPMHQLEDSMRVANPAQSLHSLTVGSVSGAVFEDDSDRSFATLPQGPSGFSRAGYGEPWSVVKPEVVELGGDLIYSKNAPHLVRPHTDVSIELLNASMHGAPAYSKDGAGTSFAAPKVAHIAAHLQNQFPGASPLLYRALIVQSARWPTWAEGVADKDTVLRLVGYGLPSPERATMNAESRVTLITPDAVILPSKQFHLYTIRIPAELQNAALEARIRIDVTLAYTALPRRTRARRTGYLETWLDWETSRLGEPRDEFQARMQDGRTSAHDEFPWVLHKRDNWGEVQETSRNRGSVQKDWAVFNSFDLPEEFAIAVRAHKGWNHLDGAGTARYCLAVSFEVLGGEVPIYTLIENEVRAAEIRALI